ncbi:hypothetical protein NL108_018610 [Boleophthalmus pectinirostris]|nr:hypothetical protein NL108_018610 [Boleophthalmus pectinirostris]
MDVGFGHPDKGLDFVVFKTSALCLTTQGSQPMSPSLVALVVNLCTPRKYLIALLLSALYSGASSKPSKLPQRKTEQVQPLSQNFRTDLHLIYYNSWCPPPTRL